jgi:hypothetical protein
MRYELRFRNGYWTLFDTGHHYGPIEIFGLKTDAETAVTEANTNFMKRGRN